MKKTTINTLTDLYAHAKRNIPQYLLTDTVDTFAFDQWIGLLKHDLEGYPVKWMESPKMLAITVAICNVNGKVITRKRAKELLSQRVKMRWDREDRKECDIDEYNDIRQKWAQRCWVKRGKPTFGKQKITGARFGRAVTNKGSWRGKIYQRFVGVTIGLSKDTGLWTIHMRIAD